MGDLTEHFNRSEFACKCGCGTNNISPLFVQKLEAARRLYGRMIEITSGCRCQTHNQAVGGEADSAHLATPVRQGLAADIACPTSKDRYDMLLALLTVSFQRVGIGENFLHVDADLSKPQDVCWTYPAEKRRW